MGSSDHNGNYRFSTPYTMFGATLYMLDETNPPLVTQGPREIVLAPHDYFPEHIGLSYPCHKDYNFMMGPPMFHDCTAEGDHGHLLLSCDDGTALLPHIIRSQSDVRQAFKDLLKGTSIVSEKYSDCLEALIAFDPVIQKLPIETPESTPSYDLSRLGFWS